eukprot:2256447-Pleurochrysis_carterae.AAC.4
MESCRSSSVSSQQLKGGHSCECMCGQQEKRQQQALPLRSLKSTAGAATVSALRGAAFAEPKHAAVPAAAAVVAAAAQARRRASVCR